MTVTGYRWLFALSGAAILASCGTRDPTTLGRPPVVQSYSPHERDLTAFVGDTLVFSLDAVDPDRDPLRASFALDGKTDWEGARWTYVVEDTGLTTVRGTVSDGEFTSYIEWSLERLAAVNFPPVIDAFEPIEPNPTLIIGNGMDFAVLASDPDLDPLSYTFTVDDSVVADSRQFHYLATSLGTKLVRARASDGERSVTHDWTLRVTLEPDTIAPAEVQITHVETGVEPGEFLLEWTAVGRDGMEGLASSYLVRTAPWPILTEDDWVRGSARLNVPPPAQPGETMTMTVGGLQPARLTYVAVRAIDDFGNISPLGPAPSVVTRGMRISGFVLDGQTGAPIPNATVTLGSRTVTTDATGAWEMTELPPVNDNLAAHDELTTDVGAYFDMSMPYVVTHLDVVRLYLLPNLPLQTTYYSDFLQFFRSMTDVAGIPYGTQQRRWELPINLYVRPYTKEGLDYRATIVRVAGEFDAILGRHVFNVVSTGVTTGVETSCEDEVPRDYYDVTEWTSDWYPSKAVIKFRTAYTPIYENVLARTARHELGHSLGLNHSSDPEHTMVGGITTQVDTFAVDEVRVIECLYTLPRGFDTRRFNRN